MFGKINSATPLEMLGNRLETNSTTDQRKNGYFYIFEGADRLRARVAASQPPTRLSDSEHDALGTKT
jgi:hypothetical protein